MNAGRRLFLPGDHAHRLAFGSMLLLAVSACAQTRVVREAPVPERVSKPAVAAAPSRVSKPPLRTPLSEGSIFYTVQSGDTVYGIAFRAGLNYRDLAAWNGIAEPYLIRVGQRLRLRAPAMLASTAASAAAPVATVPNKPVVVPPAAAPMPMSSNPVRRLPEPPRTVTSSGISPSAPASPTTSAAATASAPAAPASNPPDASTLPPSANVASSPPASASTSPISAGPISASPVGVEIDTDALAAAPRWRWPSQGPLIGRFVAGDQTHQGINIAGNAGQPVLAAADGVVVYSGSGLVGYGELIIIKHSNDWLSAYAHNRRRLVAEGSTVQAGQVIAEMGRTGALRDMLHFEIRRNGKPVDPLHWLPAR